MQILVSKSSIYFEYKDVREDKNIYRLPLEGG